MWTSHTYHSIRIQLVTTQSQVGVVNPKLYKIALMCGEIAQSLIIYAPGTNLSALQKQTHKIRSPCVLHVHIASSVKSLYRKCVTDQGLPNHNPISGL